MVRPSPEASAPVSNAEAMGPPTDLGLRGGTTRTGQLVSVWRHRHSSPSVGYPRAYTEGLESPVTGVCPHNQQGQPSRRGASQHAPCTAVRSARSSGHRPWRRDPIWSGQSLLTGQATTRRRGGLDQGCAQVFGRRVYGRHDRCAQHRAYLECRGRTAGVPDSLDDGAASADRASRSGRRSGLSCDSRRGHAQGIGGGPAATGRLRGPWHARGLRCRNGHGEQQTTLAFPNSLALRGWRKGPGGAREERVMNLEGSPTPSPMMAIYQALRARHPNRLAWPSPRICSTIVCRKLRSTMSPSDFMRTCRSNEVPLHRRPAR